MNRPSNLLSLALLCTGAWLLSPASSRGQEIRWRYNYAAARQEAANKGMPMILDFGTKNCYWCRVLDAETFTDPTVARTVNEKFIPLKVDAEQYPVLVEKLQITSYPTIILADADGKILGTMEGFKKPGPFQESLQRALARVANPEWMLRDYQTARQAFDGADYPKAVTLLSRVLEDGKSRPVQDQARRLLAQIEQQAAVQLAKARHLNDKGQSQEATSILTGLVRTYPGTDAAGQAGTLLSNIALSDERIARTQRAERARDLLAQAHDYYNCQEMLNCLDRCQKLMTEYPDSAEADEAKQLVSHVKSTPETLQKAVDDMSQRLQRIQIELAEAYVDKHQRAEAMATLERVIRNFPGTTSAERAQVRLAQLRGEPMLTIEYKR